MAPRISRASIGASKPKAAKKRSRARALDAFAIASADHPDEAKVRKSRLGQAEEDPRDRKRRKVQDDEDEEDPFASSADEDERPQRKQQKRQRKSSVGSSEAGSDSEGNTWTLGHIGEDDGSDIDSDEAFGEGDEERFAEYSFSGSAKNKRGRAAKKADDDMDLDEDAGSPSDSDESLGSDAVDLAQMLDDGSESEDEGNNDSASEVSDDNAFSDSSDEEEDPKESDKIGRLQGLVSSLHPKSADEQKTNASLYESTNPSEAGITLTQKVDIHSLLNSGVSKPLEKKVSRKKDLKLAPALPKLQQDKLDRQAASEKAKKTLDRWVDTVKQMRRADHVTFPLQDDSKAAHDTGHLLPVIRNPGLTDLESTINNILQESGLGPDEAQVEDNEFDELPDNNISVEEILERRAHLRRARELMFREEQKSKRIKKIKSKSYRRVHRKERERLAALEKDAFGSGDEMDEEEREAHDRRRAEERMGAKHRDSKWAKQMKKSGRSIWDDEARSGVTDMARRNEELRRRIAGKDVKDDDSVDASSSESDDEDQPTSQLQKLHKSLKKLQDDEIDSGPGSKLVQLKFMQRADAARKARNDEDIKRMQRELAGEDSSEHDSDSEQPDIGRQIFGPNAKKLISKPAQEERNEFEEPEQQLSEDEDNISIELDTVPMVDPSLLAKPRVAESNIQKTQTPAQKSTNGSKSKPTKPQSKSQSKEHEILSKPDSEGWITITYDKDNDSDSESEIEDKPQSSNTPLTQAAFLSKAFAGDNVEEDFHIEKEKTITAEDDQIIDDTIPGWGSWVGEGLSQKAQSQNKGRKLRVEAGMKRADRKDAKLKNVIINEKRIKKNVGFLAGTLPFPFTSRAEYERSMRMPIGGEWNVKKTLGENTKPRIIVKPGRVVMPIEKPLI